MKKNNQSSTQMKKENQSTINTQEKEKQNEQTTIN